MTLIIKKLINATLAIVLISANTSGRGVIDGYTMTLSFNKRNSKRFFFCFYGNDKKGFRVAGALI